MIELMLYLVAAVAPWYIWSNGWASTAVIVVLMSLITGGPRLVWLFKGARV